MVSARSILASLLAIAGAGSLGACDLLLLAGHDRHVDGTIDCSSGTCECKDGLDSCDGDDDNGCETDILTDPQHCGSCDNVCDNGLCDLGVCACTPGFADCDGDHGNGCEAELASDGDNCGACGKSCAGGPCQAGVCQAVTIGGLDAVRALAVSGGDVYVTRCGSPAVERTGTDGGIVEAVGSETTCADLVAVGGDRIFYTVGPDIFSADTTSPTPANTFLLGVSPSRFLASSATDLYWWSDDTAAMTQALMRVSTAGGAPETVASAAVSALAADDLGAVWADAAGIHAVASGSTLVADLSTIPAIALALEGDTIFASTGSSIQALPRSGGAATQLVQAKAARAVAADASRVYWADAGDSSVKRVDRDGTGLTTLASLETFGPGTPFAIDDAAVYWIAKQKVRKVAK